MSLICILVWGCVVYFYLYAYFALIAYEVLFVHVRSRPWILSPNILDFSFEILWKGFTVKAIFIVVDIRP
jgi:hypothetical protein